MCIGYRDSRDTDGCHADGRRKGRKDDELGRNFDFKSSANILAQAEKQRKNGDLC